MNSSFSKFAINSNQNKYSTESRTNKGGLNLSHICEANGQYMGKECKGIKRQGMTKFKDRWTNMRQNVGEWKNNIDESTNVESKRFFFNNSEQSGSKIEQSECYEQKSKKLGGASQGWKIRQPSFISNNFSNPTIDMSAFSSIQTNESPQISEDNDNCIQGQYCSINWQNKQKISIQNTQESLKSCKDMHIQSGQCEKTSYQEGQDNIEKQKEQIQDNDKQGQIYGQKRAQGEIVMEQCLQCMETISMLMDKIQKLDNMWRTKLTHLLVAYEKLIEQEELEI